MSSVLLFFCSVLCATDMLPRRQTEPFLWELKGTSSCHCTPKTKECLCFKLFRSCFHWKQMPVFCLVKSQEVIFSRNQLQSVSKLREGDPTFLKRRTRAHQHFNKKERRVAVSAAEQPMSALKVCGTKTKSADVIKSPKNTVYFFT